MTFLAISNVFLTVENPSIYLVSCNFQFAARKACVPVAAVIKQIHTASSAYYCAGRVSVLSNASCASNYQICLTRGTGVFLQHRESPSSIASTRPLASRHFWRALLRRRWRVFALPQLWATAQPANCANLSPHIYWPDTLSCLTLRSTAEFVGVEVRAVPLTR